MRLKRTLLNGARLYLILDRQVNSYEKLFEIAKKAIFAGVSIIQLRDKNGSAKEILSFSDRISRLTKNKILYIVNDRTDLAIASQASGVHLGQEDIPLVTARKLAGPKVLIGVSCQTFAHAQKAQKDGADYIGFGSVFKTLTKPGRRPMDIKLLQKVSENIKIPVFAIGGINLKNIAELRAVGVYRIAICRAICQVKDVGQAVRRFRESIE